MPIDYTYGQSAGAHALTSSTGGGTPTPSVPTLVQKNFQVKQGTNTNAVTFSSNVTIGNFILVAITQWSGSVSSITDNKGNTYTPVTTAQHADPSSDYVQLYYAKNVAGGSVTITAALSGTTDNNVGIYEYAGLDAVAPLDKITAATGTGSTPNGGTLTTTTNNELYFAVGVDDNGGNSAQTAGSGYSLRDHQDDSATHERFYSEDRVSAQGSYQSNFTLGAGSSWAVVGASFKPGSGGSSSSNNIAPSGTGYRWWYNASSTVDTNKVAATGLNDGNTSQDVTLRTMGTGYPEIDNAWEAGGITWATTQNNVTSVEYTNGSWTTDGDGAFTANLKLQFTTDGTTWTDSGWTLTPSYPYDSASTAGQVYTFTGSAAAIKGARVVGQVKTPGAGSWYAISREVKVFSTTTSSSQKTYTYDANGNMLSDGTNCSHYNEANQLDKVTKCSGGQTIAEYVYDYNGLRMVKRNYTNGVLVNTVTSWSDSYETKVIVGGATENTTYYFANSELIAKKNPDGTKQYIHNDHLGSTSVVTNQSGALVELTSYDPYGKIKAGGTKSKFLYTGQEHDGETGLEYYNARYYSSDIRRFTQPDTYTANIYNPQDLNAYSYVLNNPLRYTDPTGHNIVFANGMLTSTFLSSPQQQKKTSPAVVASYATYSNVQSSQARQTGSGSSNSSKVGSTILGASASSSINAVKNFITQPQTTRGICANANFGVGAFGTCSACIIQTKKKQLGGTFSLGGGGSTGFAFGVGGSYMQSSAKDLGEVEGQDIFVGGSALLVGSDYSWDRNNPKIRSFNSGFSIGPDYSPEFGPAALIEFHGGSTKTWTRTLFQY